MVQHSYLQVAPYVLLAIVQFVPSIGLIPRRSLLFVEGIVEGICWVPWSLLRTMALGQVWVLVIL